METVQKQTFKNQEVVVDNKRYEDCTFSNCKLVYQGGALPVFARCEFPGTGIQLDGPAQQTVKYLRTAYKAGMWSNVDSVLNQLKQGKLANRAKPSPPPPEYTGTNWTFLAVAQALLIGFTILLIAAIWNGNVDAPRGVLENDNQPLVEDFPLNAMPALPDSLAEAYDLETMNQVAQTESYTWVDEESGVVAIPVEDAFAILLEEGLAPAEAAPDEEQEGEDAAEDEAEGEQEEDTNGND